MTFSFRRGIVFLIAAACFAPHAGYAFSFNPNFLLADQDLTNTAGMDLGDVHEFLQSRGALAQLVVQDTDGGQRLASEIIWRTATRNGVNPQVVLVMLQKEQGLVMNPAPDQEALDWAMGYGVHDNTNHEDPAIQRFRGFAKQINSATLQFTEGYLADLLARGRTSAGFGPGITSRVSNTTVTPVNNATAALYTYTPHIAGNQTFARLWDQWFQPTFISGTLVQNTENGAIWLIQQGKKRPITSEAAWRSRFPIQPLIPASPNALDAYEEGAPISFANYSLLHTSGDNTFYLVDGDTLRPFASQEVIRALGLPLDEFVEVQPSDLTPFLLAAPITSETSHPTGALLQLQTTGGVYFVENGLRHPVISRAILESRFHGEAIRAVPPSDLEGYMESYPIRFADGTLLGAEGDPRIYVISDGAKRPIPSEGAFLSYGWQWSQIVWTDAPSLALHPLGDAIEESASAIGTASLVR